MASTTELPPSRVVRWPILQNPALAYGCALGLVAVAFLIRWYLDPVLENTARLVFFMIAAALSAFLFGRGPGIVATVTGLALAQYFFVLPHTTFPAGSHAATIGLITAAIQGILISICAGYLHRALRIRAEAEQEMRNLYEAERRAHESAEELNRTKDYFLAVLSHELRGPLSAITLCVSDRLKIGGMSEDVREDFAFVERNAQMQSRLIGDLLDLTRITRGKLQIEQQPLDLSPLLTEAIRTCSADGQKSGPVPILRLHAHETRIMGDHDRLLQVFWNILRNAQKFTPAEGRIEVETFGAAPGRVGVRIRDTGVGLTTEALERIFHPFEQAERETNKKHGGLGLGLAIAQGLVELHNGTLTGHSDGPGTGTTFTIELPVLESARAASSARPASSEAPPRSSTARPPVPA